MTLSSPTRQRELQRSLLVAFLMHGIISAVQIPRVPDIIDQIGVTFAQWGVIVGFLALGSAAGLGSAHWLVTRLGGNRLAIGAFIAFSVLTATIGFIQNPIIYFIVAFATAFCMSTFTISVNAQSVVAQNFAGKIILGRFHAAWSIGAAVSAAASGFLTPILDIRVHFVVFAAVSLTIFLLWGTALLNKAEGVDADDHSDTARVPWRRMPKRVYLLAAGLFVGVFPEAAMIDWSAILTRDGLGLHVATRSIPYAAFAAAMIAGRLLITSFTRRMHFSTLASVGALISGVSVGISIIVGPQLIDSNEFVGVLVVSVLWGIAGFGTGAVVPSIFSAVNTVSGMSTADVMARMSLVEMGMIALAKIGMGAVAQGIGITSAFWIVVAAWFAVAVISWYIAKLPVAQRPNR